MTTTDRSPLGTSQRTSDIPQSLPTSPRDRPTGGPLSSVDSSPAPSQQLTAVSTTGNTRATAIASTDRMISTPAIAATSSDVIMSQATGSTDGGSATTRSSSITADTSVNSTAAHIYPTGSAMSSGGVTGPPSSVASLTDLVTGAEMTSPKDITEISTDSQPASPISRNSSPIVLPTTRHDDVTTDRTTMRDITTGSGTITQPSYTAPMTSQSTDAPTDVPPSGLTQAAIIGIAVGVSVAVVIVIVVLLVVLLKRRSPKRQRNTGDDNVNDYRIEIRAIQTPGSTKPTGLKTYFSQEDDHSSPAPSRAPSGITNPTYGSSDDVVSETAIVQDPGRASAGDSETLLLRPSRDSNFNDRALQAQSRISIGPVLLDGQDYTTKLAYDKMFSTNTFK